MDSASFGWAVVIRTGNETTGSVIHTSSGDSKRGVMPGVLQGREHLRTLLLQSASFGPLQGGRGIVFAMSCPIPDALTITPAFISIAILDTGLTDHSAWFYNCQNISWTHPML
jgi:hypothetical protein